jgi:general secretion pathway protein K
MTSRHPQRGLALITAVLVMAIVATISTYLMFGQQVWWRQVENLFDRHRAESMRHAGLEWIAVLLARDAKNNKTDHLGEEWAKTLPPLPFEGGVMKAVISDAQARFNLNGLVRNGQPSAGDIGVFRRLLAALELDPALAEAVVDWIDPDSLTRPGGAEDTEYLSLPVPYRAANQPLTSVDELRLIKGFDAKAVEALRPHVVALPEPTAINANTASEIVLAALFPNLPPAGAQQIVAARDRQPFSDGAEISNHVPAGTGASQVTPSASTFYFLVQLDILYGRSHRSTLALIHRTADGKAPRVLWHHPLYPKLPSADDSDS